MKQIRVERRKGFYGIFRALGIRVDGVEVGKIRQGEVLQVEVPESSQEIWGQMDWGETIRVRLEGYEPDQIIVFRGYFTFNVSRSLAMDTMPFEVFLTREAEVEKR